MRSLFAILLWLLLVAVCCQPERVCAQPPMTNSDDVKTGPVYTWEPRQGNPNQFVLLCYGRRIGVFDAKTRIYRAIDAEGNLTAPTDPPWKGTDNDEEPSLPVTKTKPVLEKVDNEDPQPKVPPWMAFLVGGGITVVILFLGFLFWR